MVYERDRLAALQLIADASHEDFAPFLTDPEYARDRLRKYRFSVAFRHALIERSVSSWQELPFAVMEAIKSVYPDEENGEDIVVLYNQLSERGFSRQFIGYFLLLTFTPMRSKRAFLVLYFSADITPKQIEELKRALNGVFRELLQAENPNRQYSDDVDFVRISVTYPGSAILIITAIAIGAGVALRAGLTVYDTMKTNSVLKKAEGKDIKTVEVEIQPPARGTGIQPQVKVVEKEAQSPSTPATKQLAQSVHNVSDGNGRSGMAFISTGAVGRETPDRS